MGFPEHCSIAGLGEAGNRQSPSPPCRAGGAAGGEELLGPFSLPEQRDPHAGEGEGESRETTPAMAERKQNGRQGEEEEVPAFFKNLGSGSPKPRQKFCGMFCPVEGSLENKTIDFDSLSVGRGCNKVVAKQKDVAHLGPDAQSVYSKQSGKGGEPSVEFGRKVEIRSATGKEALQNLNDKYQLMEFRD